MSGLFGQEPVRAVVDLTSATLPAVAAMVMAPVVSGVGRGAPFVPPDACWTR